MKIELKLGVEEDSILIFEQKVCKLLSIKQTLFDQCVKEYKGYAYLLRGWIREMYYNGNSPTEVAKIIKKSNLRIECIKIGEPLYIGG